MAILEIWYLVFAVGTVLVPEQIPLYELHTPHRAQ